MNYGVENWRENEAAGRAGAGNYSPSWLKTICRVWANCLLGARCLLLEKSDQTKKSNGNKHCQVCVEIWVWQNRHTSSSSSLPTRRRSVSCPPTPSPSPALTPNEASLVCTFLYRLFQSERERDTPTNPPRREHRIQFLISNPSAVILKS